VALGRFCPFPAAVLPHCSGVRRNADPALGLDVHRPGPLVPMPPDGVMADPALGLDLHCLDPILPMPPGGVVADSALGLGVHRLDPLVPRPPSALNPQHKLPAMTNPGPQYAGLPGRPPYRFDVRK
jgi:hypothetical protein